MPLDDAVAGPLAVATITRARSETEEDLLELCLARLAEHRWPVFVTDRGSRDAFIRRLRHLDGIQVAISSSGDLTKQIDRSISDALSRRTPFILYTEPDKQDFFEHHLTDFVVRALHGSSRAVALASRTPAAYRTFPPHQQATEAVINASCDEAFSRAGDYSYGPFIMPRDVARQLSVLPDEIGWGWRHMAFGGAHRIGYDLSMVEGEYECPHAQRAENVVDRDYRDRQLAQNLQGLHMGLTVPLIQRSE
jgi:hypothetical protein